MSETAGDRTAAAIDGCGERAPERGKAVRDVRNDQRASMSKRLREERWSVMAPGGWLETGSWSQEWVEGKRDSERWLDRGKGG